jgi:hypothetical protein
MAEIVVSLVAPGVNQLVAVVHLVVAGRVKHLVVPLQPVAVAALLFRLRVFLELAEMQPTTVVEGEEVFTAVEEVVMLVEVEEDRAIVRIVTAVP